MNAVPGPHLFEAPIIDSSSAPYYAAAAEGRLLGKRCLECDRLHWYPRHLCPYCLSATVWIDLRGTGEVYAATASYRGREEPFVLAYVRLDEGITILTNIVDSEPEAVSIGDRVEVTFAATTSDTVLPVFRLTERSKR